MTETRPGSWPKIAAQLAAGGVPPGTPVFRGKTVIGSSWAINGERRIDIAVSQAAVIKSHLRYHNPRILVCYEYDRVSEESSKESNG